MMMINLEQLSYLYVPAIIPFKDLVNNIAVIQLKDGTILDVWDNSHELVLEGQYTNFEEYYENILDEEDFESMYFLDLEVTKEVQKTMPEVRAIYLNI